MSLPNKFMNTLNKMSTSSNEKEEKEKKERTRIVLKPLDKDLRNSAAVRKATNKALPGVAIRNCRITVGGSILLEFNDADTAQDVDRKWKPSIFGGNNGLKIPGEGNTFGIVKHVYDDTLRQDEMEQEIITQYDGATCEFFTKGDGSDKVFTGIIKIDFKERNKLEAAMSSVISIGRQKYHVEEYRRKLRVIKCARCQGFGHVHRMCRSAKPKCGKCSSSDHESKDCNITSNFKCAHCDGNHITGVAVCPMVIKKLEEIKSRSNYGF
jgi:hypothetical protein